MAIANVSLSDTFDNWRIRTNEVIITVNQNDTKLQSAYDTANASYIVANTGFDKANSANYYSYLVDANSKAAFDAANIAIANVNYVNAFAYALALDSENATVLIAIPGYNKANAANYYAYLVDVNTQAAFLQSNTAYLVANNGYGKANSANYYSYLVDVNSKASFLQSNTAYLVANNGYGKANSANVVASAAFDKANSANVVASSAFGKANSANVVASSAFGKANTACTSADTAQTIGIAAFGTANLALPSSSYTASDVLSKLLTVDGSGSLLDADRLDGQEGSYYRDASNLNAGTVPSARLSGSYTITASDATSAAYLKSGGAGSNMNFSGTTPGGTPLYVWGGNGTNNYLYSPSLLSVNYASSAGDADTLDGQHGTYYAVASSFSTTSSVRFGSLGIGTAASGTSGEIRATNDITAYYSSDKRLKENIKNISNALDKIMQINGVTFDWTDDHIEKSGGIDGYFTRKHDVGVIAQELKEVLPEAVAEREDGILAVKYDRISALLIEAIKELKREIELLKSKVGE